MSDQIFQEAYARVRARHTEETWLALSPRQITDAIYREIRQIDSERNATRAVEGMETSSGSHQA